MVKIEIVGAAAAGKTAIEHLKETNDVVVVEHNAFKITDIQMIPIHEPIEYIFPPKSGREKRRERRKLNRSKKRRRA